MVRYKQHKALGVLVAFNLISRNLKKMPLSISTNKSIRKYNGAVSKKMYNIVT